MASKVSKVDLGDLDEKFDSEDRERLLVACRALRTSYVDFIHFATMQAIDEMEGYAADAVAINSFYGRP